MSSRYLVRSLLFAGCFLMVIPSRSTPAAAPRKVTTVEGITEYQLDNGLRLLLLPDASRAKVTVNMTVLVGSRQEGYGETGMAHLLEHLVFKGTPTHPHIPKALQDHGAQFNGSTNNDRTNYFETLNATDENLEFALRLEADRLVNSRIRKEDLDSEMTVVRNEFEMGENSPAGVLNKRICSAAYEWHNYGKTTIGNRSDIERVPIENLQAFYRKFYQPDNVVVIIAGQFDESKVLGWVQQYFGAIPRPDRKLDNTYTEEPPQDGERVVTLRRVGSVSAVGVAYHIPAGGHEDIAPLQVLSNILDMRPSGRLYKLLVESKKASSVVAYASGEHDPGLMTIQATVPDPKLLDEVRDIILSTVEQLEAAGVSQEEVFRARQQFLTARLLAGNDSNRLAVSLSEWVAQGDWRLYFLHRDRMEQVTLDQVQAVARRYLQRNNRTVGMFIPTEKAERVSIPNIPDLAQLVANYQGRAAVAAGESFDPTPANVESRVERLSIGGVQVTLLPKKSRGEEVCALLTLRYGNAENLRGFESAAGFLPDLMLRGTQKLSDQQLRDELDKLQASLSSGVGGGGRGRRGGGGGGVTPAGAVTFSVKARRETLPAVLGLLRQVLREPRLPAEDFEVMKRSRLAMVEQMRTEPAALASRLLQQSLSPYPKGDVRYVPTVDESIELLNRVTYDQVTRLYHEFLGAQAGELSMVGDFDPSTCLPVLEQTFEGWTGTQSYARIEMASNGAATGGSFKLITPDKANATYVSGVVLPLRDDDADYPALLMANFIFGGGSLSSRLGNRVRQQEGLSYGVGSSLSASSLDRRTALTTNAICNPQNISKVEHAMAEELQRLLRDGVTAEELAQAKQGFLQSQKVSRSSDSALAAMLAGATYAGRTLKFQSDLESAIAGLTAAQVNTAVRKYVDPAKLVIVTAGDFEAR